MLKFSFSGAAGIMEVHDTLTSGMVGKEVNFSFSEEWRGLTKVAVFTAGKEVRDGVISGNKTVIPAEVLRKPLHHLHVGVYGVSADGTVVIPTIRVKGPLIEPGANPSGDAGIMPKQQIWAQILSSMGDPADLQTEDKSSLVNAINELANAINGLDNCGAAGLSQTEKQLMVNLFRNMVYKADMSQTVTQLKDLWQVAEEPDEDVHVHSYISAVTKPATCTAAGVRTYSCGCGDSYTEDIPATGHNYENGTCINCGAADPDYEEEVTLSGISATYSGGDVEAGTAVSDLTGIVVTAHYSDGSSQTVTGYTLSGEIVEGSNAIAVSYGGLSTTFTVNGVAAEDTLLYNWDFTKSLTDTVSGAAAIAEVTEKSDGAGVLPVQDSEGVHFVGPGQALNFGSIFELNRTYEIDVAEMDYQGDAGWNARFFTLWQGTGSNTVSGFLYRHTYNVWSIYSGGWASSPYDVTDRNAFAGKTVTLKIAEDGMCELLLDGVSYGTCDKNFTAGWPVLQLGSTGSDGPSGAKQMGANLYNCTITGFRIYEGVSR